MLSAVKNFALTLIISLLVFSILAYVVVGMVLTNLSGITGKTEPEETTVPGGPAITDSQGGIIELPTLDSGSSFNMLIALTDYDPVLYKYNQNVLDFLFNSGNPLPVTPPSPTPTDLAAPKPMTVEPDSDPEDGDGYMTTENGDPIIPGGLYDQGYKSISTTQLILLRFDHERREVTFTAFPEKALVVLNEKYIALGDIYATYGKDVLCDEIHAMTGCIIDKYLILHPDKFVGMIDALGGVYFNVPCDMSFTEMDNSVLTVKAGGQLVNGATALKILGFDLYFGSEQTRENTAVEFARAVLSSITQITNYPNAYALFEKLSAFADTDFTKADFDKNCDFIYKYPQLQNASKSPVTRMMQLGDAQRTIIDEIATLSLFADYRRIMPANSSDNQ